jgi:glycosyltransferase involved in cell wall biosynthesis
VVVVDDGSTDGSREVIDRYRHRVVTVEQANGGQAAALNAGFAACKGDLVIFLDADDELRPQAAERVVQHFRPGVAKLQFRLDAVDKDGAPLGFTNPPASQPLAAGWVAPSLLSKGRYTTPVMSGNAFARGVLERILPIPVAEWRISADGYLVTAAPLHGTVFRSRNVSGHTGSMAPMRGRPPRSTPPTCQDASSTTWPSMPWWRRWQRPTTCRLRVISS